MLSPRALVIQEQQQLSQRLAEEPQHARLYVLRGMASFKLGEISAALADFNRAEECNPALTPYLWQRGLAYYYAGRFAEGARQFEVDLTVNGHDVEETVWRYLCQAREYGAQEARARLLPVRRDARPVMHWIYGLFADEQTPEAVLTQHGTAAASAQFYSRLYVGLYWEAQGNACQARRYITQAAAMQYLEDYMGWLALVHQQLRGWNAA
ncbi:MAG: hypothetical protein AB7N91_09155 [Candidatus Tectimicrobiota bacterium]